MSEKIVPIILAGGQGTRLWPLSRSARPKQFLLLTGEESLYQQTLRRAYDPAKYSPAIVVTNDDYRFLAAEQAAELNIPLTGNLLEPATRNTAMAIASAAVYAMAKFGRDALLHVLPSDHAVSVGPDYYQAVQTAAEAARQGKLVTFGVTPTSPETGYGYIKAVAEVGGGAAAVEQFVEKPRAGQAKEMLAEGSYFWNSGMFMMGADAFLRECARLAPDVTQAANEAVAAAAVDLDFIRLGEAAYAGSPSTSIDYAVFERTKLAAVVAVNFGWSDLGSWNAVWENDAKDASGNVARGAVTLGQVSNSLIVTDHAHVVVDGLDDMAVVATNDAIYVGRLSDAQKVGGLVKQLRANRETTQLTEIHRTAYRPWGGYTSILNGDRFQVKKLFVKPGKKLSLQKHHHRAEHWVVVRGTAEVTVDGQVTTLSENQSIYLPLGCVHRLANPGKIELELIEVQTGAYLGEDDIIRISDEFGRA